MLNYPGVFSSSCCWSNTKWTVKSLLPKTKRGYFLVSRRRITPMMITPLIDDEKLQFCDSATSSDVLEHSLVDEHPPVRWTNTEQEKLLTDDINQLCCTEHYPFLTNEGYMDNIRKVNDRLEMVKNMARPGCSYEVLNTALSYMSALATILSAMPQKLHASL